MRVLLLFRGAAGCGKSTFIEKHGLKPYTLCADDIRLLCQSPIQTPDGSEAISQSNDKTTWEVLFKILETRMSRGEFTVIDATNSKTIEMTRYRNLAEEYRYRIYIIDMTDISIEEVKRRNAGRDPLKRVPEFVIDRMYSRFKTQKIPSRIQVLKPDQLDEIWLKKFNMDKYKKICVIGDIHGCYTVLKEYFDKFPFSDDNMYIFVGDYLDRGIENAEVMKFILSIYQKSNVLLLFGNHEYHIGNWANDKVSYSKEFELFTRKQLEEANIDKKEVRQLYRKLGQCAWFKYRNIDVFVSHAGIAKLEEPLTLMATDQFIHGVGGYKDIDEVTKTWNFNHINVVQIHGHRNIKSAPIQDKRVFNLEGKIEFGGYLRVVHIENVLGTAIISTEEIKNNVFKTPEEFEANNELVSSNVADVLLTFRSKKGDVSEKKFGNISSFNFSRNVFNDKKRWNGITTKARGLFINTEKMKIVARSYNKFFNINEMEETKFNNLEHKFQFPVTAYVKENGYLGMISYNEETADLFYATKSDCSDGPFKQWLIKAFEKITTEEQRQEIKTFCKLNNVTLVFENVDMENDPHIIKYDKSTLYLLDIIYNTVEYKKLSYESMVEFAGKYNLPHKTLAFTFTNWQEFYDWYIPTIEDNEYEFEGRPIEGFVLEDSMGFMTKMKLSYYNFWKFMRGVAHETIRKGYITDTAKLTSPTANYFYGWLKKWCEEIPDKEERYKIIPVNIVTLRDKFYDEGGMTI